MHLMPPPFRLLNWILSTIGIAKAAVFPVPVCAIASKSSPFWMLGIHLN